MPKPPRPARIASRPGPRRWFARLLCLLFATVGVLPFVAVVLARTQGAKVWAASQIKNLLRQEFGLRATFAGSVRPWPLTVSADDVRIESTDASGPAIIAEHLAVRPRVFSLIQGRFDAGDIEIDRPRAKLVVRDGNIANLSIRTRAREGQRPHSTRPPFASVAVNDASFELSIEGVGVSATGIDFDMTADEGPSFELSLRTGSMTVERNHPLAFAGFGAPAPMDAQDDDVVCKLEAKVQLTPSSVFVRRLRLVGSADTDAAPRTAPPCELGLDDDRRVELDMRDVRSVIDEGLPRSVAGHVRARAPLRLLNRLGRLSVLGGWVSVDSDVRWDRGMQLPEMRGTIEGRRIALGIYKLATDLIASVHVERNVVHASKINLGFADGRVEVRDLVAHPLEDGAPLQVAAVDVARMQFPGLMRDLGVTDHTHVRMEFQSGSFTSVSGTIDPLRIESELVTRVGNFEVFDSAFDDPARKHMVGVHQGTVRAKFVVTPRAVEFQNAHADFGRSHLNVFASLGYANEFRLTVAKGGHVELDDVSPLVDIPWAGESDLSVDITGLFFDPMITSELSIGRFEFAGFSFGDVQSAKVRFRPMVIDVAEVAAKKSNSRYRVPTMRLDFRGPAPLVVDADIESSRLDLRDLLAVLRFENDPRFKQILGTSEVHATLRYELGTAKDRCGGGWIGVRAKAHLTNLDLFEERYEDGDLDFDYRANDRRAQELGIEIDARSILLHKGGGTIVGSGTVRNGGEVKAHLVASDIPLSKVQAFGGLAPLLDATFSATADVGGTIDQLEANVDARMTPLRLGTALLPASRAAIRLTPVDRHTRVLGRTSCGLPVTASFDAAEYERDLPQGVFHTTGQLFGGQLTFDDLRVTRQRHKVVTGQVAAARLDFGALTQGFAVGPAAASFPKGVMSGTIDVKSFELDMPARASATLVLSALEAESAHGRIKLREGTPTITLDGGELDVPKITLDFSSPYGLSSTLVAHGKIHRIAVASELDLEASLLPTNISALAGAFPQVERMSGVLQGRLSIKGSVSSPRYGGEITLRDSALALRAIPVPIEHANVDIRLDEREIKLERANAQVGGGSVTIVGSLPIQGFNLGTAVANVTARNVSLPLVEKVKMTVDADLSVTWSARVGDDERSLPRVVGDITLVNFEYARPMNINADIGKLAQRGRRTSFEVYNPDDDFVGFEVRIRAANPARFRNNLVDAQLLIDSGGLALSGTNQRAGLRGDMRVKPGGRLMLRRSEFEVRQGLVHFDDPARIAPSVDITAVTEYRRYSQAQPAAGATGTAVASGPKGADGVGKTGGQWRIQLHAYGDADNLHLDLTSEPALSQEDIVLLLTLGVTRAELDQMQASNLGETAALEALSTLTGADSAVRGAIPVIDDFRLGSAYSSRTGRTEPTVTVGKRLTERVRANVTSGLSENREVRSNVEWQLAPKTSVLGSYDNVNNVSSSSLGNLGADMRFRIEFE